MGFTARKRRAMRRARRKAIKAGLRLGRFGKLYEGEDDTQWIADCQMTTGGFCLVTYVVGRDAADADEFSIVVRNPMRPGVRHG